MRTIEDLSIQHWIMNKKTETGERYDLKSHLFFFDILNDFSPLLAGQKPAQIGWTTMQILKMFWGIRRYKLDAIYTLPSNADAQLLSKGKITRLQANNPDVAELVKDGDSMGFKRVGENALYIMGTWGQKSAMMHSSSWNVYDEIDSSKQDVIEQMATRLQHSTTKWEHMFSHPSTINVGVNKYFEKSDQKHWFIKCEKCNKRQFLEWPKSLDLEKGIYVCKFCKKELSDEDRRVGEWVKKYKGKSVSGYQLNLLMCSWISAKEIIKYHTDKSAEYFTNKVLGLPYVGAGNKVTWDIIKRNLTTKINPQDKQGDRIVIGCDTGLTSYYVVGNRRGLFYYGSCKGYDEIEVMLKRWKKSIVVFDAQGDLMQPRYIQEKYPGRVFLCYYGTDRKTQELVKWGEGDEFGKVIADRNRCLQLLVDEMTDARIPMQIVEDENDWYEFFTHWNNIYRVEEENALGIPVRKWERSGPDHFCHSLNYFRIGMSRFGGGDIQFTENKIEGIPESPTIEPDNTMKPLLFEEKSHDWRLG